MKKYIPIREKIVVKIIKEKKTQGGIILVENSVEHTAKEEGEILAMGSDVFADSSEAFKAPVKVGDLVQFARYAGKQCTPDDGEGNEIRVMRDIDILCKIEEV